MNATATAAATITCLALLCFFFGLALLIAIRRCANLGRALDVLASAFQDSPLRFAKWRKSAPHCGGLWLIAHSGKDGNVLTSFVRLPHGNISSALAQIIGADGFLHGSLGPLPRPEESDLVKPLA